MNITLKGGTVKTYDAPVTAADVAKDIGMGLYKSACGCRINGVVCDLRTVINEDCALDILTFDDNDGKHIFRHTAAHMMAQAVKRLYPNTKLAIGPAVEDGFYYDFDSEVSFTPEILEKVAKLNDLAKQRGQSLAQMAVAWILAHQPVTSVIIGPRTVEQLKDSLGCGNTYFTDEEKSVIDSILL